MLNLLQITNVLRNFEIVAECLIFVGKLERYEETSVFISVGILDDGLLFSATTELC